jgi:hypothetical protein
MTLFLAEYRQKSALTDGAGAEEEEVPGWYVSNSEVVRERVMLGVVKIV